MIDPILAATYTPTRRERMTIKLAEQLEHLSIDKLAQMASGASMSPTTRPTGNTPSTMPNDPPGASRQGVGSVGGQSPMSMESPVKMASAVEVMQEAMRKHAGIADAAKAVQVGRLLRQNAVPLATGVAGMGLGAYEGAKDGGGLSGAIGGGVLGGAAGAAVGKAGQIGVRAGHARMAARNLGGKEVSWGAALKGSVNQEARQAQQALGMKNVSVPFKRSKPVGKVAPPTAAPTVPVGTPQVAAVQPPSDFNTLMAQPSSLASVRNASPG